MSSLGFADTLTLRFQPSVVYGERAGFLSGIDWVLFLSTIPQNHIMIDVHRGWFSGFRRTATAAE